MTASISAGLPFGEPSPAPESVASVRLSGFERLSQLAQETDGFLWLSGADEHLSRLTEADAKACGGWLDPASNAFSFCVNGVTFTATEDPQDGYRSALHTLFERPGNHCQNVFPPLPLRLAFDYQFRKCHNFAKTPEHDPDDPLSHAVNPALVSLRYEGYERCEGREAHPHEDDDILCVGTSDADDYYPSFVGYFSPELFTRAFADFQRRVLEAETDTIDAQRASSPRL